MTARMGNRIHYGRPRREAFERERREEREEEEKGRDLRVRILLWFGMLRIVQTIHVVAAGVWLGSLVMTGAYAGLVFRTMRTLNPSLPDFGAYPGEHWRLAGGM